MDMLMDAGAVIRSHSHSHNNHQSADGELLHSKSQLTRRYLSEHLFSHEILKSLSIEAGLMYRDCVLCTKQRERKRFVIN